MWKIEIQQFVSWKNFFFSETKIWTLWIVNKRTLDCFKLTNCFKLNHINKKQCQFEWSDPKADCLFYVSFYLVMLCWIFSFNVCVSGWIGINIFVIAPRSQVWSVQRVDAERLQFCIWFSSLPNRGHAVLHSK